MQLIPSKTDENEKWSEQFNSPEILTSSELETYWAEDPNLSPNRLQQWLQDNGFDTCFVHEWFVPGTRNPIVSRDPSLYINPDLDNLLVNLQYKNWKDWLIECGDGTECGQDDIECGIFGATIFRRKDYEYSDEEDERSRYFYVCGETFPDPAAINFAEYEKLERLIFRNKSTHLRCVLIVVNEEPGIQDIVDDSITDGLQDIVDDALTDGIQDEIYGV